MNGEQQSTPDWEAEPSLDARIPMWAGKVYDVLAGADALTLASVARRIPDATTNEIAMALGWLAREGRVRFSQQGAVWTIRLGNSRRRA